MRPNDLAEIRNLALFEGMEEENFSAAIQAAYLQNFPAQVLLANEGDDADFLFIVIDGCVELFALANGREATMAMVGPADSFILAAVIKDAPYLMSARTLEKSRILMVPAQNIRNAFEKDGAFARATIEELADCYRIFIKEYKNLKLRTAVERLANRLLDYNSEQGKSGVIKLPHDKKRLAALLGMTPENLSRAFITLKPYGVKVRGSEITLNDMEGLITLAKPNQLIDRVDG
ncbi:MAG: cyclic nucleotide-binding domain-containing protein [Rhizobiaceae bacterium]|nr:cyclic nucleotide-binding domain-containing protein [Rhizobiaceae bacterium]